MPARRAQDVHGAGDERDAVLLAALHARYWQHLQGEAVSAEAVAVGLGALSGLDGTGRRLQRARGALA